jgi:hypothetical protein
MRKNKIKNGGGAGAIKRWRSVAVAALVAVMVGASNAWAAPGDDGMAQVKSFANNLANYVTAIAASVAVLFIAINGVKYTTAGGNPSKQLEAKNGLVAAWRRSRHRAVRPRHRRARRLGTPVTAQRVTVPVPAETGGEDRLAGSLTFRHAAYLTVAAAGVAVMLLGDRSVARLLVGALVAMVGVAGAAVRPYGEPLDRLVPAAVAYLRRRRAEARCANGADSDPEPEIAAAVTDESAAPEPAAEGMPSRLERSWSVPWRAVAAALAVLGVVAVAVARWPRPVPAQPPVTRVVVVTVPVPAPDPWEEVLDDAVDSWLDDIAGT